MFRFLPHSRHYEGLTFYCLLYSHRVFLFFERKNKTLPRQPASGRRGNVGKWPFQRTRIASGSSTQNAVALPAENRRLVRHTPF